MYSLNPVVNDTSLRLDQANPLPSVSFDPAFVLIDPAFVPIDPAFVPIDPASVPIDPASVPFDPAPVPFDPASGTPRYLVEQVYTTAYQLRHNHPSVEDIINRTRTILDYAVVSAILEGALRSIPVDKTSEGTLVRKSKAEGKAANAERAEQHFVEQIENLHSPFLRESEQRACIRQALMDGRQVIDLTPDITFRTPTVICGLSCSWIEHKNYFGFRSNPYVALKNERQLNKYSEKLGPGMVVYKLGFEHGLIQNPKVYCFREAEVLQWLATAVNNDEEVTQGR